ncbi:hypothetical protein [Paraburkholderia silvatlantica]|uniref:hypothetical protein n=1 Tax=Paraburkholderia silvatlantica TaxID=321895 RepID=UPI0037501684
MMLPPWKIWGACVQQAIPQAPFRCSAAPLNRVKSKPVRQENAFSDVAFFSLVWAFSQEYDPLSTSWRAFD